MSGRAKFFSSLFRVSTSSSCSASVVAACSRASCFCCYLVRKKRSRAHDDEIPHLKARERRKPLRSASVSASATTWTSTSLSFFLAPSITPLFYFFGFFSFFLHSR